MHLQDHIHDLAEKLAGNWREWIRDEMSGFIYHDPPWEPEDEEREADSWCLIFTSTRDSGLIDQSNEAAMNKALKEFVGGGDFNLVRHGHWGPGYLNGYEIRVYDSEGNITPVFAKFAEMKLALEEYPVLDEDDYSNRQYKATCENISMCGHGLPRDDAPADWPKQVYGWLWDNNQQATNDLDDHGGYPSTEEIEEALVALGFNKEDE